MESELAAMLSIMEPVALHGAAMLIVDGLKEMAKAVDKKINHKEQKEIIFRCMHKEYPELLRDNDFFRFYAVTMNEYALDRCKFKGYNPTEIREILAFFNLKHVKIAFFDALFQQQHSQIRKDAEEILIGGQLKEFFDRNSINIAEELQIFRDKFISIVRNTQYDLEDVIEEMHLEKVMREIEVSIEVELKRNTQVVIDDIKSLRAELLNEIYKLESGQAKALETQFESKKMMSDIYAAVTRLERDKNREDIKSIIKKIRETKSAELFIRELEILEKEIEKDLDRKKKDFFEINYEIASVTFLTGQICKAQKAVENILNNFPEDLYALTMKGHIAHLQGNLYCAEKIFKYVLEISIAKEFKEEQAASYCNLGIIYGTYGKLNEAEKVLLKALKLHEELGSKEGMASDYCNLGNVYGSHGELSKAEELINRALKLDEEIGNKEGMARDYGNLGIVYGIRREFDKAEGVYIKSFKLHDELGSKEGMAHDYCNLGNVYLSRSELDKAEEMYNRGFQLHEELGSKEGIANNYCNIGIVFRIRGELDKAEEMYNKAFQFHEELGSREGMANDYCNLGIVYGIKGEFNKARDLMLKSLDLFKQISAKHKVDNVQSLIDSLPE